jgi:pimeloyl-ACP methyl ester carboxylesterase
MAKTPLLLLHGALGAKTQFDPWLSELSDQFDLHTLDFEGHGSQPFADRPFAIAHFAENVEAYIAQHGLVKPDVFGYSMGGYVALWLAARKPDVLGRIFTFATKLDWHPAGAAREVKMLDVGSILEKVPKFAQALETRHYGNDWKQHLALTAEMMIALGNAPALLQEDISRVVNAVRMGIGDRDTMVTLEETIAAYRVLPNGQLLVMPNTPHPIEKMDVKRICTVVKEYFI